MVALIWATVAAWFFYGEPAPGYTLIEEATKGFQTSAPALVNLVCNDWLGIAGAILAMLGVVAAPITSGDTAFRSARLIVAEWLKLNQRPIMHRLYICIPLFAISIAMLVWQIENPDGAVLDHPDSSPLHDYRLLNVPDGVEDRLQLARTYRLSDRSRLFGSGYRVVLRLV